MAGRWSASARCQRSSSGTATYPPWMFWWPRHTRSSSNCRCAVASLHELQRRFAAALLDNADAPISADIRPCGISARARLEIYRTQLRATFLRTLALEFPVIERLVG